VPDPLPLLTLEPIGVVHTPFAGKRSAPRQSTVARDVAGRIELRNDRALEHALCDIERWSHLWLVFWFHLNPGWRAKVAPPRSPRKRGVFATRSPHRPNPLGLSVVALERVDGLVLHVRGVDMVDGTPLLDIKPYVPYSDALDAGSGWLASAGDPGPSYRVQWAERALEQLQWLREGHGVELRAAVQQVLSTGPSPHPYRRIKPDGDRLRLAHQDWRLWFVVTGDTVTVHEIGSGYRARVLGDPDALAAASTPLAVQSEFSRRIAVLPELRARPSVNAMIAQECHLRRHCGARKA
jgi:tRNA-Thr(GGU) m(6)t(6)A37 methyltransferase TsaA